MKLTPHVVVCLLFVFGCAKEEPPPDVPELIPVSGTVTLDGKPVEGAVVLFIPTGSTNFSALGATDAEGKYKLQTRTGQQLRDGVPAGEYRVAVSRMVKPDGSPLPPDPSTPPAMVGAREQIAPEFSLPGQSRLKARVAQGSNTFDFDVKAIVGGGGPPRP